MISESPETRGFPPAGAAMAVGKGPRFERVGLTFLESHENGARGALGGCFKKLSLEVVRNDFIINKFN